jgi:hypothetical protein
VFSTFFTLFFIPALFSLCLDGQASIARWWRHEGAAAVTVGHERDGSYTFLFATYFNDPGGTPPRRAFVL